MNCSSLLHPGSTTLIKILKLKLRRLVTRETQGLESWFSWQEFLGFSEFRDKISQTTQNAAKISIMWKKSKGRILRLFETLTTKTKKIFDFFYFGDDLYAILWIFAVGMEKSLSRRKVVRFFGRFQCFLTWTGGNALVICKRWKSFIESKLSNYWRKSHLTGRSETFLSSVHANFVVIVTSFYFMLPKDDRFYNADWNTHPASIA